MTQLRICFVGDSLTNGTGDHAFLGWPGRICRREVQAGHNITCYNLGIRAETTEMIRARWRAECTPRLLDSFPGALVFSFGTNDTAEEAGQTRVAAGRSIENARAMIAEAMDWKPTLWIGPPPIWGCPTWTCSRPCLRMGLGSGPWATACIRRTTDTRSSPTGSPNGMLGGGGSLHEASWRGRGLSRPLWL